MTDPVSSLIIRQMDLAAARHKVLAHNLANYGTPGYAAKGASFEGTLEKAKAVKPGAPGQGQPAAAGTGAGAEQGADAGLEAPSTLSPQETAEGLEMQMARLADNTGRFSALARILSIREKAYENAIRGR